ncbi:MAG: GNAT family N-acetyltransferase, partial [Acidimicrobiales bacterium]
DLPEVVSFTGAANVRSQAVMRRIGMTRDRDGDFDHPSFPAGHRLGRHVLYRATAGTWRPPAAPPPGGQGSP